MSPSSDRRQNRTQTLLRGIQSSGLCVLYHDADLGVRLVENLPPSWPSAETLMALGDAAVFDPFTSQRVLAVKREVLASGKPRRIEAPQQRDGEPPLWFELSIERDDDGGDGVARGLFVSITDISLVKRREAALRELLYEVSHRSRNLLAILQSILGQTAQGATSVAEFEAKFRGRIASLAQSQDLITYANWQGVKFRRLVDAQTESFLRDAGVTIALEGGDPVLAPNVALHLGLALHELAANSAAYGVLAHGAGRLRVACSPIPEGHRIEWHEEAAQPVPVVESWGFGRTILQNVVPRALRAEARYAIDASGVRYALDLPQPEAEIEA
jgi:two-component sensor histidine kinase